MRWEASFSYWRLWYSWTWFCATLAFMYGLVRRS
jgi:hypothetical protein